MTRYEGPAVTYQYAVPTSSATRAVQAIYEACHVPADAHEAGNTFAMIKLPAGLIIKGVVGRCIGFDRDPQFSFGNDDNPDGFGGVNGLPSYLDRPCTLIATMTEPGAGNGALVAFLEYVHGAPSHSMVIVDAVLNPPEAELEPAAEAPAVSEAEMTPEREALLAEAEDLGMKVDKRWSDKTLAAEIEAFKTPLPETGEDTEAEAPAEA